MFNLLYICRYDTVRHYRGHGISSEFHCAPFVKVRCQSILHYSTGDLQLNALNNNYIIPPLTTNTIIQHFRNMDALELVPGMIFTIEPMITEGSAECTEWSDNWTVATMDGGRAAQFEHTVLITEEGVEVLTLPY